MENGELTWNNALAGGKYIQFEDGVQKQLLIANAKFEKRLDQKNLEAEPKIAFVADVLEENGKKVSGKVLDTTSIRMQLQLKPIFALPDGSMRKGQVRIQVTRIGEGMKTVFSVKEIGGASAPSSSNPVVLNKPESMTMQQLDDKLRGLIDLKDKGLLTQEGYDTIVAQLSTIPISD